MADFCPSSTWPATGRSRAASGLNGDRSAPVSARQPKRESSRRKLARILEEAYELFSALRLEHQVTQLERGSEPDDRLDPQELDPLTRRYLRDAFREVGAVQRSLAGGLPLRR